MPSTARRRRLPAPTAARWARVRLFAMDVDGVLTDGTVQISSDGSESKAFSILDGHGLRRLARAGVAVAWISGRSSGATSARAKELAIPHVIQGPVEKLTSLQALAGRLGLGAAECAYMGDDEIDVAAMRWAGIAIAPPAAMPVARAAAHLVTERAGGHGAVREVCELLLAAREGKRGAR
ncbi:MAG: KdsC family phosphatase [Opitutaceae bacterium]